MKILDKFQNDILIIIAVDCVFMYVQCILDKIVGVKFISVRSVLPNFTPLFTAD